MDFEYIVILFNVEVLLLEINLIKKYDFCFNICLKDDKIYLFIKIMNEWYLCLIIIC